MSRVLPPKGVLSAKTGLATHGAVLFLGGRLTLTQQPSPERL